VNPFLLALVVVLLVIAVFIGGAGIYGIHRGEKVPGWITVGIGLVLVIVAVVLLS
jgi:hypothetical protein